MNEEIDHNSLGAADAEQIMREWIEQHPWVLIYFAALFAGSVISFIILMRQVLVNKRLQKRPVTQWPIHPPDFALFICILVLWFIGSSTAVAHLIHWLADGPSVGTWAMLIGGLVMQIGMAYIFFWFHHLHWRADEGPINPRFMETMQAMKLGFFYFLASLPIIYFVGLIWGLLIDFVRALGLPWEPSPQDSILIFRGMDSPLMILTMIVLAVIIAPIVEEIIFRAGIFRFFKGRVSFVAAILISSLVFGLVHANIQSFAGLVAVGACLCVAYELSGNLKVAMFFHGFFNLNTLLLLLMLPEGVI
ncbi:MAG: CPBP family intramembrane metalloprotease [Opitutales bacterium]|nr:CPBP family intramembrane metalloprotease [Opitutales bacterium]